MKKNKQFLVTLSTKHLEMLNEIQKRKGYITKSTTVHQALLEMYERLDITRQ